MRAVSAVPLLVGFIVSAAWADEREQGSELERVISEAPVLVVTATRQEATPFDVPRSTSTVGWEEIQQRRSRRTLPDALLDLPSVMVQRTGHGQASPYIRGFTGFRNVMLVDGIRLNNSVFRSGPNQYWSTIDSFAVERLEVVRGVSSVLYGSDAIGGAVNAVARRRTTFEPGVHFGVRSVSRYATAEHSFTQRIESQGNVDDLGWFAGATYRSYGDLDAGRSTGRQPGTGYRDTDGDLRLDFRQGERLVWTLAAQHVDQDAAPRTHKTVDGIPFEGTVPGTELRRDLDQTRDLVYGRMVRTDVAGPLADELQLTVSWQRQREQRHRDRDGGRTDIQGFTVDTLGLQAQATRDTGPGRLTYGIEWWHDDVDSYRRDYRDGVLDLVEVQGPVGDDAEYDLLGVFAQQELFAGETEFLLGARWTYAAADANRVDNPQVAGNDPATPGNIISVNDSWTSVVGSVRAVHPLADGWNLFGGVSQGFRAPNLSDLTRLDATSGVETPSTDLDPEDYLGFELGVKAEQQAWSAQVTVWRTHIDDQIVQSPTGRLIDGTQEVRKDNVGDGWMSGVEAEAAYRLDESWTVSALASWMDGDVDQFNPAGFEVDRPVSRLMPLSGTVTLAWARPGSAWSAWGSVRLVDDADQLSLRDEGDKERIPPGGTPGYEVLHLGAGYRISESATLSLALENVTGEDYRIHGSGVNEPGRNLVLTLEFGF